METDFYNININMKSTVLVTTEFLIRYSCFNIFQNIPGPNATSTKAICLARDYFLLYLLQV